MDVKPRLVLSGNGIRYNGRFVGQYGVEYPSTDIIFCSWKPLLSVEHSYPFTVDILENLRDEVTKIYIVDKKTKSIFRFRLETYLDSRVLKMNNQSQFVPPRTENTGMWKNRDNKMISFL